MGKDTSVFKFTLSNRQESGLKPWLPLAKHILTAYLWLLTAPRGRESENHYHLSTDGKTEARCCPRSHMTDVKAWTEFRTLLAFYPPHTPPHPFNEGGSYCMSWASLEPDSILPPSPARNPGVHHHIQAWLFVMSHDVIVNKFCCAEQNMCWHLTPQEFLVREVVGETAVIER